MSRHHLTCSGRNRDRRRAVPNRDLCVLSLHYPPETTGNAPYTGALVEGLAADGHRVTAHTGHPHYPEWQIHEGYGGWRTFEHHDGVQVQRRLHYVPQPPRGIRRLVSELSFGLRLVFARWGSPRVVIAVTPSLFSTALAVARLRLTPRRPALIVWVQDVYSLGMAELGEGVELVQRVTRWVERFTFNSADRIVVIHQRFADFLTGQLGISSSKITVIRNWTHLEPSDAISDSSAAKAQLGWPSGVTLAVHTGNMGGKQGLENIVDAARIADKTNAPVRFILVGEGSERRLLEESARGVASLQFVDPLEPQKFRLALAAADLLLVNEKPGVSAMSVPSKLTSYFDAGRPIVAATDPGGITASEVTDADAGVVVPAGDPHALLAAVLALRSDSVEAERYGLNGKRHRDKHLGQGEAIKQWERVVTAVAADRRLH